MQNMSNSILLFVWMLCVNTFTAATCPQENQVYTGMKGIEWTLHLNGISSPLALFPADEPVFSARDVTEIVVKLDAGGARLQLPQVQIETRNAIEVRVKGVKDAKNVSGSPSKWIKSSFVINGKTADDVTILVTSLGEKAAIKNVFVKGCAHVEWCGWGDWSSCTVSCGGGKMTRTRVCQCKNPTSNTFKCSGQDNMTKSCNTDDCLLRQFQDEIQELTGLWLSHKVKELDNKFYTVNASWIENGQPIIRGRKDILDHEREFVEKFPITERQVHVAVQMSEIRAYTIHTTKLFDDDMNFLGRKRVLIIWKLEDGIFKIDVLAITEAD